MKLKSLMAASMLAAAFTSFTFQPGFSAPVKPIEGAVQRLIDIQQIEEVMGRHAWYYSAGQHQRELDELFSNRPDVSFGTNGGYWVSKPSIQKFYVDWFYVQARKDLEALNRRHPEIANVEANLTAGTMMMHTLTTPVVVVAEDGKTAKGLWYSPGEVTQTPLGQPTANWMWERYAIDFIKEDGQWRIWHFNVFTDITVPAGGDWTKPAAMGQLVVQPGEVLPWADPSAPQPDIPVTVETGWGVKNVRREFPLVPVPYKTFSETFSYGPPQGAALKKALEESAKRAAALPPPK